MPIPASVENAIQERITVITAQIAGLDTGGCEHCNYRTSQQIANFTRANELQSEINELEAYINGGTN